MNKVVMIGRLTDNPQSQMTSTGTPQSKITIATQDNKNKKDTYFFPCIAWQSPATFINTYLKKGDLVAIDGRLTRRNYTTKDGKQGSITEIIIDSINTISANKKNENEKEEIISVADEKEEIDDESNQTKKVDWDD